jgi:hypothetical protein
MIVLIYFLLSVLIAIEAMTSIARKAGYIEGTPTTGLFLQSSMALLSRVVVFLFMPLIGYLADADALKSSKQDLFLFLIPITFLLAVSINTTFLTQLCIILIKRMNKNGSLFKGDLDWSIKANIVTRKRKIYALNKFYFIAFLSYVPYYIAWPLTIVLLGSFNESRAMVLGMASVFNGVSTIVLTIIIDPALAKYGLKKRCILSIYDELVVIRIKAIFVAYAVFSVITYFFWQ